jgi:hypothetical protein
MPGWYSISAERPAGAERATRSTRAAWAMTWVEIRPRVEVTDGCQLCSSPSWDLDEDPLQFVERCFTLLDLDKCILA